MKVVEQMLLLAVLAVAGSVSAETKTFKPGTRNNAVRVTICPHDDASFRLDVLRTGADSPASTPRSSTSRTIRAGAASRSASARIRRS